ncbi:MAG: family 10 glycosylhydrolase [Lentisphaerae bacterium]|nr:family 10 glycosylhydrolase [Lentisphaerota bacterium]
MHGCRGMGLSLRFNRATTALGPFFAALALFGPWAPCGPVFAAAVHPFASAAASAWVPGGGAPAAAPAPGGGLEFRCVAEAGERTCWDRALDLNLAECAAIELDCESRPPGAFAAIYLYLRSGRGWYVWRGRINEAGRQTLYFQPSQASVEGKPKGWNAISGLRLALVRGAGPEGRLAVFGMRASECRVAIVRAGESAGGAKEQAAARGACARVSRWLFDMGVANQTLDEAAAASGGLEKMTLAILPYNPDVPGRLLRALRRFERGGGRLMVCYSSDAGLAGLMRMELGPYKAAGNPGQWSSMVFSRDAPAGVPSRVGQESGNIRVVRPLPPDSRVIAWWADASGKTGDDPAWVRSGAGVWMTHILQNGDDENKKRMMAALLGAYDPEVLRAAARRAAARAVNVGPHGGLASARAILAEAATAGTGAAARERLARAEARESAMREALRGGRHIEVLEAAADIKALLTEAYALAQSPTAIPFRGVWNHSGMGLYPGDWPRTCRELKAAGIRAVFPNVLWAGQAHYPSQVVPCSDIGRMYGDQVKACVAAAHAEGLEAHAWKVCWNLGGAPAAHVARLKKEGRLQRSANGAAHIWLCPSNPDNVRQELNAIMELVRNYPVDGVHLDYARFPDSQSCVCPVCRKNFEAKRGRVVRRWPADVITGALADEYRAWRSSVMTGFIRAARGVMRSARPAAKLSAAVYGQYPQCAGTMGQSWGSWVEEGLVDFVCPMNYDTDPASFAVSVRKQLALPRARGRIYPGIGVTAVESRLPPDQVIAQIRAVADAGAAGFMLFDLNPTLQRETLPILRLGITRPE